MRGLHEQLARLPGPGGRPGLRRRRGRPGETEGGRRGDGRAVSAERFANHVALEPGQLATLAGVV